MLDWVSHCTRAHMWSLVIHECTSTCIKFSTCSWRILLLLLQAAHCYLHIAALVAEYLKRRGTAFTSSQPRSRYRYCNPTIVYHLHYAQGITLAHWPSGTHVHVLVHVHVHRLSCAHTCNSWTLCTVHVHDRGEPHTRLTEHCLPSTFIVLA